MPPKKAAKATSAPNIQIAGPPGALTKAGAKGKAKVKAKGKSMSRTSPAAQLSNFLSSGAGRLSVAGDGDDDAAPLVATAGVQLDDEISPGQGEPPATVDSEETEPAEGTPDERAYSKAQKRVFDSNFKFLAPEVKAEWLELSQPGGAPGKQKRNIFNLNEIDFESINFKFISKLFCLIM